MLLLCLIALAAVPAADAPPPPEPAAATAPAPAAAPEPSVPAAAPAAPAAAPSVLDEPKLDPHPPIDDDAGLGATLIRTLAVLGLVIMLAYISLNWGLRRLLGIKPPSLNGGLVSIVERVPLDQRRTLFVVKAANEYLLVGGAESALSLISKLDAAEVEKLRSAERAAPALTLSPFLQKLLSRKGKPS
jgi:flagellar biogenesis protein FliO